MVNRGGVGAVFTRGRVPIIFALLVLGGAHLLLIVPLQQLSLIGSAGGDPRASGGARVTFSDYAEVTPGLFVGAHPEPEDPFDLGANVVVCLTSGTSVRELPRNGLLIHWPIKDGPVPDQETLRGVADLIVRSLGSGASVYLHCQAGMNRAVLVAALVLMHQGMTAEGAIERVREVAAGRAAAVLSSRNIAPEVSPFFAL